ncbi:MAG: hypothetical protein BJ554DRAFT_424, partial [Olpidium bornovanus]
MLPRSRPPPAVTYGKRRTLATARSRALAGGSGSSAPARGAAGRSAMDDDDSGLSDLGGPGAGGRDENSSLPGPAAKFPGCRLRSPEAEDGRGDGAQASAPSPPQGAGSSPPPRKRRASHDSCSGESETARKTAWNPGQAQNRRTATAAGPGKRLTAAPADEVVAKKPVKRPAGAFSGAKDRSPKRARRRRALGEAVACSPSTAEPVQAASCRDHLLVRATPRSVQLSTETSAKSELRTSCAARRKTNSPPDGTAYSASEPSACVSSTSEEPNDRSERRHSLSPTYTTRDSVPYSSEQADSGHPSTNDIWREFDALSQSQDETAARSSRRKRIVSTLQRKVADSHTEPGVWSQKPPLPPPLQKTTDAQPTESMWAAKSGYFSTGWGKSKHAPGAVSIGCSESSGSGFSQPEARAVKDQPRSTPLNPRHLIAR